MTKKLKNLSLSLTCVRQLPRQREPSVYGWQITSARLAGQQKRHLCQASCVRAMPENEKPPAMRVDFYFNRIFYLTYNLQTLSVRCY